MLVIVDGPLKGLQVQCIGTMEVGRGASIDLTGDEAVSRYHATITATANGIRVSDAGSTNGTFVNGQRITSAEARVGDMIQIGNTIMKVEAI